MEKIFSILKKYHIERVALFAILFFTFTQVTAQIPAGYYDSVGELTGEELKTALYNIIKGHTKFPYTSSNTDVWDILKEADRDPNNVENVLGIYSNFSMNAAQEYNNGSGWNREHVWAKSRGDFGTSPGAGTDTHHLRAADISTNSARSNRNFDTADTEYIDGSGTYSGVTGSKTSSTNFVWEPRNVVKGDVARMIFYMATRYEGENGEPDLELTETLLTNTDKSPLHAKLSVLLEWHLADEVSAEEQRRNDIIYGFQKNRNPYIDHPEYVCEVFDCDDGTVVTNLISNNLTSGISLNLYPNPVKDELIIDFENIEVSKFLVSITNATGQTIYYENRFGNENIDIRFLDTGIYYLRIIRGEIVLTKKFIKI